MRKGNPFRQKLEQMEQRGSETPPAPDGKKPIERMSGEELDAAIDEARRELLDAQHAELRSREQERLQASQNAPLASPGARALVPTRQAWTFVRRNRPSWK